MKLPVFLLWVLASALLLVSCAGSPPPPPESGAATDYSQTPDGYYRVKRGDTLHAIAFRFSLDWREIARLNGISSPYTIYPDQMLRLYANPTVSSGSSTPNPDGVQIATVTMPSETATRPLDTPADGTTTTDTSGTAASKPQPAEVETGTEGNREPASQQGAPVTEPASESSRPATVAASDTAPAQADPVPAPAKNLPPPQMTVPMTPAGDPARWLWPTEGRILSNFRAGDATRKGIDIAGQKGQPIVATAPGTVVYSGSGLIGYGELIIIKHSDRMLSAYAHNSKRLVSEGQQVGAGTQIAEMGSNDRNQALLHFEIRVNGSPEDPLKYLPRR